MDNFGWIISGRPGDLLEVSGCLYLPHRLGLNRVTTVGPPLPPPSDIWCSATDLHESVSHHDSDVSSTVAFRPLAEVSEVLLRQMVWSLAQVQLEHIGPGGGRKYYNILYSLVFTSHEPLEGRCKFSSQTFSG